MVSPELDTPSVIGLNLAAFAITFMSFQWAEILTPLAQVAGIAASLATMTLAIRKIYLSFRNKKIED